MSVREHFSLTFIWAFPLYFGRRTSDSSAGETNDDVFLKEMGAQTTFLRLYRDDFQCQSQNPSVTSS